MTLRKSGRSLTATVTTAVFLLVSVTAVASGQPQAENQHLAAHQTPPAEVPMKFPVPESLTEEHAGLHADLERAIKSGGETGKAAQAVAAVLHPHFVKEEKYALPPLALLPALARGEVTPGMAAIVPLTEELQRSLPQMLAEHQQIQAALARLVTAAQAEHKPDAERFAHELIHHAQTEEQITYPAAILVGEYVKLKLSTGNTPSGG